MDDTSNLFRLSVGAKGKTSMRSPCAGIITGLALLALSGCGDPGEIVPIAPPGANIPKVSPDASPAEAQGETVPSSETPSARCRRRLPPHTNPRPRQPSANPVRPRAESSTRLSRREPDRCTRGASAARSTTWAPWRIAARSSESSRSKDAPESFRIGGDALITGMGRGLARDEGRRASQVVIPSELAYREQGKPPIPPNSNLVFEVELLSIAAEK